MKMYDKNGNLSTVAREIFNSGLERMRSGESAIDIAKDLRVQVKLVKYEGPLLIEGQLSKEARTLKNKGEIFQALNRGVMHKAFARELVNIPFPMKTKSVTIDV